MKFCEKHYRAYPDERLGCSFCYEERKPAKVSKAKPPQPIKLQSEKKKARERELAKVRKKKKQEVRYCETCGATGVFLSYSHIVKVSGYMDLELHPENAILECIPCHAQYEHGSLAEKMKQKSWPRKLTVILKLKPDFFNKMQLKSNTITS